MTRPLQAAASQQDDFSAARTLARAARFAAPFRGAFAAKGALVVLSLLPSLLLPWPIKAVIDHGILGTPVDPERYPFWLQSLVVPLVGRSSTEILVAASALLFGLLLLAGAYGTGGGERDSADARLANGFDLATRSENDANEGWSFAGGLFGLFDFRFTLRLSQRLNHYYRSTLFRCVQRLPMSAFDEARIGDALYRVMYDTPSITQAAYRILLTPVIAPAMIALTVLILRDSFGAHPLLVWTALALAPVTLCATYPVARRMRQASGEVRKAGSAATSTAEEGLAQIAAVQSLGSEEHQRGRFGAESDRAFARYRGLLLAGISAFVMAFVPALALIGYAFLYVCDQVIAGHLSPGDFTVLFGYFLRIGFAAADLGGLWFVLQGNAAGLARVSELLDLPSEVDPPDALAPTQPPRRVSFESVGYAYPDGTAALSEISLELGPNEVVALVGPAGAGKTTLAQLIPGFARPTAGRICIDGTDATRLRRDWLRSQVAYVFQETVLFAGSVAENIRLGRPGASDAEVEAAARLAGAHDFIAGLPHGYATSIGRAGSQLSVGQKSRISIARALVRNAPILVLDEPTAALDPETEAMLVASLDRVRSNRLVVVIAHRLSTVREADRIVFLRAGRIVEVGSHSELIARPEGAYRRFLELQAGERVLGS